MPASAGFSVANGMLTMSAGQELEDRVAAIESRMVQMADASAIRRNEIQPLLDYVAAKMEHEVQQAEFWRSVRVRVATGGIFAAFSAVCSVIWYAANAFIKSHGGS